MIRGLSFLMMFLFLFFGCKEDETSKDLLTVQATGTSVGAGETTVDVAIVSTVNWEATEQAEWITVNPSHGTSADTKAVVEVAANTSSETRTAEIVFTGGNAEPVKITIEQAGAVSLTFSKDTVRLLYSGNSDVLEVRATSEWSVEVAADSWCKVDPTAGTAGTTVLEVSAGANDETERMVKLMFKRGEVEKELVVVQAGESMETILAREREVLMKFYNATNGRSWSYSYGWGDDKVPVSDWAYVKTDNDGRVVALNIGTNELTLSGSLPAELKDLKKLRILNIGTGNFAGAEIPEELGELENLEELTLKQCGFTGEIPASIFKLTKLKILDLGVNNLSGSVPAEIRNLTELTYLSFERNRLSGDLDLTGLSKLEDVYMLENNFTGDIKFLETLTSLVNFSIWRNKFTGEIPAGIGNLQQLESLQLAENNITGSLPKEIVSSPKLHYIDISLNRLSGMIPDELLNWEYTYIDEDEDGNEITVHEKFDWSNLYNWNRVCNQQAGYGFDNAPVKPIG